MSLASSCVGPCENLARPAQAREGRKKKNSLLLKGTKSPKQQGEVATAILPGPRRPVASRAGVKKTPTSHQKWRALVASRFQLPAAHAALPPKQPAHTHLRTHMHTHS
ncbi:hypothetical protein P3342_008722 [Pyrenophora teres f. teres]|nr:hypothetical protein P3342_008722 [Pyrenophora teres f. teres]